MVEIRHRSNGKLLLSLESENLKGTDLARQDLGWADLKRADLRETNFIAAKLRGADLREADMQGADLRGADLTLALLAGANLANAKVGQTTFAYCIDLAQAFGLAQCDHRAPSHLDNNTLKHSIESLSPRFLEGCGYTRLEIETLRALYVDSPIKFYSCFLSHGEKDLPFAERLLADLRQSNVSCWHYKEDMRGGEEWAEQINRAIKVHDKLLLICSRHSVYRKNVVKEILRALEEQRETGRQKLFPIMLDKHILSEEFMDEAREKVRTEQWDDNWVPAVRKLHIPDFSGWETDHASYKQEFEKLLQALQASEA